MSMFENARNVRISGKPTFQTINGPYHYHDHTSNTTNNNTTNITGNDFSQTVHNHNTYTVAHSQSYNEGDRRSQAQSEAGAGVPLQAYRAQRAPALPYTQQQFPVSDGQLFRPQSNHPYCSSSHPSPASMHPPMGGVAYGNSTHHYSSFQPGQIMFMSPQVSANMTEFFRGLEEQVAREEESEMGTIEDAEYEDVPSHPLPAHASQLGYAPPPHTTSSQRTIPGHQPSTSHPPTHQQPYPTPLRQNNAPYSPEQPPSQHTPSRNPIPPRVRRTLQAAFAFSSNLGESSHAPIHTSTTSSSMNYDNASTSSSDLPFSFEDATGAPQGVRMDVHDGSVEETRRTENTTTSYQAVVADAIPDNRHWEGDEQGYGGVYGEEQMQYVGHGAGYLNS